MADLLESHRHLHRPGPGTDPRTLLMLHGTGDSEAGFAGLAPMIAPEAAVLSVRGNVLEHGMARFFRRHGEGVYDMDDLTRRTDELAAFIDAAREAYGLRELTGVGYSNGANILVSLLLARPDLLRGAVLMHPLIPFALPEQPGLAGLPVLITGGERDPIAPLAATRALADGLAARGAEVRAVLHAGGHELRPEEVATVRDFLASSHRAAA